MASMQEIKASIAETQAAYLARQERGTQVELRALTEKIKELRGALSSTIAAGAKPCPHCGASPHGMEQPLPKGRAEYEIGCLSCGDFEHTDGTRRKHSARGGPLPRHAVEAWNEGPDFWTMRERESGLAKLARVTKRAK